MNWMYDMPSLEARDANSMLVAKATFVRQALEQSLVAGDQALEKGERIGQEAVILGSGAYGATTAATVVMPE